MPHCVPSVRCRTDPITHAGDPAQVSSSTLRLTKADCTWPGLKTCTPVRSWARRLGSRMTKALVARALSGAVSQHRPPRGVILHSKRGSQYCAKDYQRLIRQFGLCSLMSRKGNCYDNAPMESFWSILKTELVHHRPDATRAQAMREITEYIEIFYNRERRHSKINNLVPAVFAKQCELRAAAQ